MTLSNWSDGGDNYFHKMAIAVQFDEYDDLKWKIHTHTSTLKPYIHIHIHTSNIYSTNTRTRQQTEMSWKARERRARERDVIGSRFQTSFLSQAYHHSFARPTHSTAVIPTHAYIQSTDGIRVFIVYMYFIQRDAWMCAVCGVVWTRVCLCACVWVRQFTLKQIQTICYENSSSVALAVCSGLTTLLFFIIYTKKILLFFI